uniref:TRAF3-interacting protein 1 n=1 Tax=Tetraodon nigroviridis TaxID=99883 RepID=H3CU11_TETNG
MNAAVVKKTQETLGKVIKKPVLTEKLLNRPPFRFLRDIFVEVIKNTGFMKGLYEETELNSDAGKDKDAKMAFLQKAIDVVMLVSGEPLAVKPVRVVCGHEPERTNELLQALAKCCLAKLSSDEAVRRVVSGEKTELKTKASTSRSQDKENREGREANLEKNRNTAHNDRGEQKDSAPHRDQEGRRRDGEKEHPRGRERSDKHQRREQEARAGERRNSKVCSSDSRGDKSLSFHSSDHLSMKLTHTHTHTKPAGAVLQANLPEKPLKKVPPEELSKTTKSVPAASLDVDVTGKNQIVSEELVFFSSVYVSEKHTLGDDDDPLPDSPARIPRPSSAKGQRRRPKSQDESDSEENGDGSWVPNGVTSSSATRLAEVCLCSCSRRSSRPSSARPAPPQIKKQENHPEAAPAERSSSAKTSVPIILDGKRPSEEDDDNQPKQFVVEEMVPLAPGVPENVVTVVSFKHYLGALVKKILDTKKDYETSSSSKLKQSIESEVALKKEQDTAKRETERVCSSIQTMCRSTQFLAKNLDYVQENIDAMQAELIFWCQESKKYMQACEEEERTTEKALEPRHTELLDLEQQIVDMWSKIRTSRANILRNEEKREKLLRGISFHHGA